MSHTTATPDGDRLGTEWHARAWYSNGGTADLLIVPARTAGATVDEDGITLFAIDADAAGMSRNAYATVDGLRAAEITLDGVRADCRCRYWGGRKGFAALDATIDDATLAVCAEAVGIMYALKDKTVQYSKDRSQFGVPIGSFQALQHRMVDMLMACEQAQSLLMWAVMSATRKVATKADAPSAR